jgi:polyhydroxyalkanoate synthase
MLESLLAQGQRAARVEANRALLRFVNGVEWLVRDPASVVGRTPFETVYERDKLRVRHYQLAHAARQYPVPVLMIPPLMVKPFIFDLYPERSLVAFFLRKGFPVYLVDFGEPDDADAYVRLDDYVLDWIPTACDQVRRHAGSADISLLGYCMGGLFALSHTAANDDRHVRNLVAIATPVDMHKMGLFAWVTRLSGRQAEALARQIGNVPGGLSSTVFRMLTPMKNITRYADLFMNLWNREYVNGFDAMNQWVSQFIAYPQAAFIQFNREFMQENRLVKGDLTFGGRKADLTRVRASLLAFASKTDQIAPFRATRAVMDAIGTSDKTLRVAPGGHMGIFAGGSAPEHVWGPATEWLAPRSRAHRPRTTGASAGRRRHDARI